MIKNVLNVVKLKLLLIVSMLFVSCAGTTLQGTPQDYYNYDRFEWTDYDNGVHILAAHSISLATSQILYTRFHFTKLESGLIGILLAGGIGTWKETMHDAYTSKTDLKCWWGGALSGAATFTIINF